MSRCASLDGAPRLLMIPTTEWCTSEPPAGSIACWSAAGWAAQPISGPLPAVATSVARSGPHANRRRGDDLVMAVVTMRQMLEAGVHFGHQTRRWNPKMRRFIFGERGGIYIIDLEQTLTRVEAAYNFVRDLSAKGGTVMFIGTKKQAQDPVRDYAEQCGMPYVNERWLGGMLTNFETIAKRVSKMQEYERMKVSGEFDAMPKKEALLLGRELEKLQKNLGGIRRHDQAPGRGLRARHEEGAHRRHRGEQAGDPGRRRRRHQRRPRRRAVPDPGQRRRHPGQRADVAGSSPRPSRRAATSPQDATRRPSPRRRSAPSRRRPRSPPPRPRPAARPPPPRPSATPASPPAPPTRGRARRRRRRGRRLDEGNATDAEATVTPGATAVRGRSPRPRPPITPRRRTRRPRAENEKRTWHSPQRTYRRCARPPAPG